MADIANDVTCTNCNHLASMHADTADGANNGACSAGGCDCGQMATATTAAATTSIEVLAVTSEAASGTSAAAPDLDSISTAIATAQTAVAAVADPPEWLQQAAGLVDAAAAAAEGMDGEAADRWITAVDAAVDAAVELCPANNDDTPADVGEAVRSIQAIDDALDAYLKAGGIADPDEQAEGEEGDAVTAAADEGQMQPWSIPVLVVEGTATGDGRFIQAGSLEACDLPATLMALDEEGAFGHEGAFPVGRIDTMERYDASALIDPKTGEAYGEGVFAWKATGVFTSADIATEIITLVKEQVLKGVSADIRDVESILEILDENGEVAVTDVTPENTTEDEFWDALDHGRLQETVTKGRVMGACHDSQTEILTEARGWRKFDALASDDRVATRDSKTCEFEWQQPTYHHVDQWRGRMIRFTGGRTHRTLDLLVTPNHRMLVESIKTGKPMIMAAEDLITKSNRSYRIPTVSEWTASDVNEFRIDGYEIVPGECACGCGQPVHSRRETLPDCTVDHCARPGYSLGLCTSHYHRRRRYGDPVLGGPDRPRGPNARIDPPPYVLPGHGHGRATDQLILSGDEYAAFMGAYLSEGSCGGDRFITISQRPTSKARELYQSLFDRFSLHSRTEYKGFIVHNRTLARYLRQFGTARDKYVPVELKSFSARQLRIFFDYYMAGDGSADGRRAYTSSRRLAGDLQEIAQKIGMWAVIGQRDDDHVRMIEGRAVRPNGPQWIVQFRNRPAHQVATAVWDWRAEWVDDYRGEVRCVSVPNEVIYVRRNGIPAWSGNTICPFPAFEGAYIEIGTDDGSVATPIAASGSARHSLRIHDTYGLRHCAACEEGNMVAAAAPMEPPSDWFDDPGFGGLTPLTIQADGRVYGHMAAWGTCHTGVTGRCVTPPRNKSDYAYFRTGAVRTDDGELVRVGQLTLGTGHASLSVDARGAIEHYDHTGTAVADVATGEDRFGIWVAGALRPDVTELQVRQLRAAAISGDWRNIGGRLEMVGALAVNVPGFPVVQARVASGAEQSLVAAGGRAVITSAQTTLQSLLAWKATVEPELLESKADRLRRTIHA